MKTELGEHIRSKNIWIIITSLIFFVFLYNLKQVNGEECTMARQLLDPAVRSNYLSIIESSKLPKNGGLCGSINIRTGSGQQTVIDPISMECISCHDGTIGRTVYFKMVKSAIPETTDVLVLQITHSSGSDVVTSTTTGTIDTNTVASRTSHAIGTDFSKYNCNPGYNSWESLPEEMVLINGEISCATCHNLLGNSRLYLSVNMSASGLCFTCHRK